MGWLGAGEWRREKELWYWGHWTEERVTGQSLGSQITLLQGPQAKSARNKIPRMLGGGWEGGFCHSSVWRS